MSIVLAVHRSETYTFSKEPVQSISLIKGEGVEEDAHRGVTMKHRHRVKQDPTQPNLRQVHLIHNELIEALQGQGFHVEPGTMGENITTSGAVLDRDEDGNLIRKAGVMAVVLQGGDVRVGDSIEIQMPPKPHQPLIPV